MTQIALTDGYYKARSIIAGAQRCLNLYPEKNANDAPFPYTNYCTPGLTFLAYPPSGSNITVEYRCLYTAANGQLFGVIGNQVYAISPTWTYTRLGSLTTTAGIVSMSDNTLAAVIVDGSSNGYSIDLTTGTPSIPTYSFKAINGAGAFYGANKVDYADTFFIFNRPNTNQFYLSLAEVTQAMMFGGPVISGTLTGGSGYANGFHANVPLTGGTGSGAVLSVTVSGGAASAYTIASAGENFVSGDVLTLSGTQLDGALATGTIAGGAGYAAGTYTGVALTGGSGTGGVATIVVSGGAVTTVTLTTNGIDYQVGDVLSASTVNIGGTGSGFTWTVATLGAAGTGFAFTVTGVGSSAFDSLDIAAKTGGADLLSTLVVMHKELWLLGNQSTSEVWYDSGNPLFAFERYPGIFINHGCAAPYSVAQWDKSIFWLGIDPQGHRQVFQGTYYQSTPISEPAMQVALEGYSAVNDAIGFCYQQAGHVFYVLIFPTADRTWVYDLREQLWHERAWRDVFGNEHRIRPNCLAFAYDTLVVGDWQNGQLFALDLENFTDNGQPILRKRGFPHILNEGKRISVQSFTAAMQVGASTATQTSNPTLVSLRTSYTAGAAFGDAITKSIGSEGQYATSPKWNQLGMGRDFVFELSWDAPFKTALSGAWIEARPCGT